jgi:four helix bundle protein
LASSFRDLLAWQKAQGLAVDVCPVCKSFPKDELYGLTSQIRRAAVSVPSNIAEGQGRLTKGEFLQSLGYARGSLLELQTQLEIAKDLGYLSPELFIELDRESFAVGGLLNRLIASFQLKARGAAGSS